MVSRREQVEDAIHLLEALDELRRRQVPVAAQARARDADGERQRSAEPHQMLGVGVPGDAIPSGNGRQQAATVAGGNQRSDLSLVAGVVEHHQHATPGRHRSVEREPFVLIGRELRTGAEGPEEGTDNDVRYGRIVRCSTQVSVKASVRIARLHVAGRPYGQCGLSHATHAHDGRDNRSSPRSVRPGSKKIRRRANSAVRPTKSGIEAGIWRGVGPLWSVTSRAGRVEWLG